MQSITSINELTALGRNRWTMALLADLAAHNGARFAELLHRLGLPRDSLARTLEAAKTAGWIGPNPGHGHPLRPEYILTDAGARLAVKAAAVISAQEQAQLPPASLTRWSLPLIHEIRLGQDRFNALARALPQASPRALSQGLRGLTEIRLVSRGLVDTYPPASRYTLTPTGLILAGALQSIEKPAGIAPRGLFIGPI